VIVVAVACLGGDGPTGALDVKAPPGAPTPPALTAAERTNAAHSACQYPDPG
jgi:hypothetical protein